MLVFMDESGHPHRKDAATRPAVVAVCIREKDARTIAARIYGLKQRLLPNPRIEIKARHLLTRATFRRVETKREFVEEFFDLCSNLPLTVFSVTMERPLGDLPGDRLWLPNQFRYLLQRAHHMASAENDFATVLIDGNGSQFGGLPPRFESFLFRSHEGQSLASVADAPYFVDSRITVGIQIADMLVSAVRLYEENQLFRGVPSGDAFLSAMRRYYRVVQQLSVDLETGVGTLRGMYRMPERAHYHPAQEIGGILPTEQPESQE